MVRYVVWMCLLTSVQAGCVKSESVECASGLVCTGGRVCSPDGGRCVLSAQIDSCVGQADGAGCSYPSVTAGVCFEALCITPGCGNGFVEPGEACDDGNRLGFDGCSADCNSNEACGNGVVDVAFGETCDCGDGTQDLPNGCASANALTGGADCRPNCSLSGCGDAVLDPGEVCDDGNRVPGDGCRADCAGRWTVLPSGTLDHLNGVWVVSDTEAYAVGKRVHRWNGSSWSVMPNSPVGVAWSAVWASGPSDIWIAGVGRVEHFDGSSWQQMPTGASLNYVGIWGSGPYDIWVVAQATSGIRHCASMTECSSGPWQTFGSSAARCIWGRSANDIFACGGEGGITVSHYTGTWAGSQAVAPLSIWGDADVVYSVTTNGGMATFTNNTWTVEPVEPNFIPSAVGGAEGRVVFIGGRTIPSSSETAPYIQTRDATGSHLEPVDVATLRAVAGSPTGKLVFVVGDYGTILY